MENLEVKKPPKRKRRIIRKRKVSIKPSFLSSKLKEEYSSNNFNNLLQSIMKSPKPKEDWMEAFFGSFSKGTRSLTQGTRSQSNLATKIIEKPKPRLETEKNVLPDILRSKSSIRSTSKHIIENNRLTRIKSGTSSRIKRDTSQKIIQKEPSLLDPGELIIKGNSRPSTPINKTSQYLLANDNNLDSSMNLNTSDSRRDLKSSKRNVLSSSNLAQINLAPDIPDRNDKKMSMEDVLSYISYINKKHFR